MALNLGELFGTIGLDTSDWDKKLHGAQKTLKAFGIAGAAMAALDGLAIGAALTKGIVDSINVEAGTDKLQAELGLTEAQAGVAGKAAGSLFAANYGESMGDVNVAVGAVMSSIKGMRDASDADVEAMTAKIMNLSTVMGVDVGRAAQVAGQMITSGIAKDGTHAADLLTASLQKVPVNVREDILDAVDEYGPFMKNIGIQGEDAMGLLVQASEKGMYGIDKTGDAIKEFGIRATDMSKATSGAYDALGLDQEDMTAKLLAGGDTAKDAFGQIIHGLQEMDDPVAQSQAALALFGTPLEDLSVTEIPNFLGALDPMGDSFDSVAGAADKMGKDLTSNAKSGFDGFTRQAEAALITFVQDNIMPSVSDFASFLNTDVGPAIKNVGDWITNDALPALESFGRWFTDNIEAVKIWATGIGIVMFPLFLRIGITAGISAAAQVTAWALASGAAVKAAAVYVIQSYVIIGRFVAMSVAALVNGIKIAAVWTVQIIGSAVAGAIAMGVQAGKVIAAWVLMSAQSMINAVKMAAAWVVGVFVPAVAAGVTMGVQAAIIVGGWALMSVQSMIHAVRMAAAWFIALGPVGWIIGIVVLLAALIIANWESISKFTAEAWANISKFVSDAWNNVVKWVSEAVENVRRVIADVSSKISSAWNSFWGTIGAKIGEIWDSIKTGVSTGIDNVVTFVRDLPGKVLGFFSNAGTLLLDAGGNIISGFLSGLKNGFEEVKNFVGGIGQWIADNKGPKAYDLKLLVPAGGWIMDGLETGLEKSIPSLKKTLGSVSATIQSGITGGSVGLTGTPTPATAQQSTVQRGGVTIGSQNFYQVSDPVSTSANVQRRLTMLNI